ncbi:response regulator transcription factor [Salibacterium aidingense]|uniref:response regulator transcription factor n=1 Tax=Salibacterium aidingense TaxID=384933 RepID=UPI003BDA27D4
MKEGPINMLIVDDEAMICEGLASTVPWEEVGIHVIGKAYNGKEALKLIEEHSVDLVLTDVYMPEMDGLALAEFLSDEHPGIEIVMFSGYDEFEYARQAIRLGVKDYLLKPVDIDELMELAAQLRDSIREKYRFPTPSGFFHSTLYSWVLHYLFHAPAPDEAQPPALKYRVLASEKINYSDFTVPKQLSFWRKEWEEHLISESSDSGVSFYFFSNHKNELVTIFLDTQPDHLNTGRMYYLWKLFHQKTEVATTVGVSTIQSDLSALPAVYQEAQTALSQIRGTDTLISFYSPETPKHSVPAYPKETEKKLRKAVLNHSTETMEAVIEDLFHHFKEHQVNIRQALNILREMEVMLKNTVYEVSNCRVTEDDSLHLQQPVDEKTHNSLSFLYRLFLEDLHNLSEVLHASTNNNWIINQALQYIHDNYHKDIKAQGVAENHFITPNYFSMLFKQETGLSFSEYLNSLRIQKAAELLRGTSNRVFEIAEYVGYKEYKYFVKVFKNHLGVTPTHYRNLNSGNK